MRLRNICVASLLAAAAVCVVLALVVPAGRLEGSYFGRSVYSTGDHFWQLAQFWSGAAAAFAVSAIVVAAVFWRMSRAPAS